MKTEKTICQNNNMSKVHHLIHEISYELEQGNIDKCKEMLNEADIISHNDLN